MRSTVGVRRERYTLGVRTTLWPPSDFVVFGNDLRNEPRGRTAPAYGHRRPNNERVLRARQPRRVNRPIPEKPPRIIIASFRNIRRGPAVRRVLRQRRPGDAIARRRKTKRFKRLPNTRPGSNKFSPNPPAKHVVRLIISSSR